MWKFSPMFFDKAVLNKYVKSQKSKYGWLWILILFIVFLFIISRML